MISRFALVWHKVPPDFGRPSHWDLLLERETACWTWALETLPAGLGGSADCQQVPALRLPDHRKHYLDYEGPVSNDRGEVSQHDSGRCQWLAADDQGVRVQLTTDRGEIVLLLTPNAADHWTLSEQ